MFIYYYWENESLKTISQKFDKILLGKNTSDIKFYRLHSSIFFFDKTKLITKIEKQLNLLLKNYNLLFWTRRYSRWAIQFNSNTVYKSINRKLNKIIDQLEEDKIIINRHHRFRSLSNTLKILDEINKKLDKILKCQLKIKT